MFNKILLKRLKISGKFNKLNDLNVNINFFLIFENINLLYSDSLLFYKFLKNLNINFFFFNKNKNFLFLNLYKFLFNIYYYLCLIIPVVKISEFLYFLFFLNDIKEHNFSSIKNKNFKKHILTNFRFIFLGGMYCSYFFTNNYLYNFFFFLQKWFIFEFMFFIIFFKKLVNFIILFYYGYIKSNS